MQIRVKQKIDKWLGYLLIVVLWPFTRLLGVVMHRDHSTRTAPDRILFIKLMGLGSLVIASDSIMAIRRQFPDSRFILLTDANIAAGIAPFNLFDEIWQAETDSFFPALVSMARFLTRSWQFGRLWVVDLEVYSKLTTVYALLTFARNRFGFFLPLVSFRKYLNTHNVPFDQSSFLEDNYLTMAQSVTGREDIFEDIQPPVLPARKEELGKPFIILNNTCSKLAPVRKLPDHTFSEICHWILEHTSYDMALLGATEDKDDISRFIENDPILRRQRNRIVNFAGTGRDFETYYRFLRDEGVCLVTIDSGPLHIAQKLGLPTVSIWGPTNPDNYLKVRPCEQGRHLSYYLGAPCSPCIHRYEKLPCGGNNVCMKRIQARAIIEKVQALLYHLASPRPA